MNLLSIGLFHGHVHFRLFKWVLVMLKVHASDEVITFCHSLEVINSFNGHFNSAPPRFQWNCHSQTCRRKIFCPFIKMHGSCCQLCSVFSTFWRSENTRVANGSDAYFCCSNLVTNSYGQHGQNILIPDGKIFFGYAMLCTQ